MLQVSSMHVISRKDFSIKGDFQATTTRQKHDLNNKICAVNYWQNVFLWLSLVFFLCSLILMCAGFFLLSSCLMFLHWSMYVHKIRVISSNTRQFNAFGLPFEVEFKFYGPCLAFFFLQMNSFTCFVSGSFAQCKLFGFLLTVEIQNGRK